ncbi:MAG TPA: hypothetical protein ENI34_06990 [candidate division WOR-3 bacterium]|uniref:Adhesin domain-containing protein n=1 Tax=candidate division WOR-3 bacterium TaxID=2052148 RepID=A0A9C9EMI3_UNCW3|nr:hypothetical protein [candidate division WOR-3 bacterium]
MNVWRSTLNERLRILKLLEQGKINADEAARLLEALTFSHPHTSRRRHKIFSVFEWIPDIITSKINGSFEHGTADRTLAFSRKRRIKFKGISGDLQIHGGEENNITIQKDGFVKIKEDEDTLEVKAITGDIEIAVPHTIDLSIKGVSGDITIRDISGEIKLTSVAADIHGSNLSGSFTGELVAGDVDIEYRHLENIDIKTKKSDITLRLADAVEAEIELEAKHGGIDCEFNLLKEKRTATTLKGIINNKGARIRIKNDRGDIVIKQEKGRKGT